MILFYRMYIFLYTHLVVLVSTQDACVCKPAGLLFDFFLRIIVALRNQDPLFQCQKLSALLSQR